VTLLGVAVRFARARALPGAMTALSVALGVSLIIATVLLTRGIKDAFVQGTTDYSLVVGAKGSPAQLVLSVVFRMDTATPNISMRTLRDLEADPRVEAAVPLALGDAYQGFRYVATSPAYFAPFPWRHRSFSLAAGRFLRDEPPDAPSFEALLGASVARGAGLSIGDRFHQGEEMAEYPLTVAGILHPTRSADDRAIFISLASFWAMNEVARALPVKPLTAVLVRARRMSDLPSLNRELNVAPETQSVFPSAVLLAIFNLLAVMDATLAVVLAAMVVVVLLSVALAMYGATLARRREIATMRALGARRVTMLRIVLAEASTVSIVGGLGGLVGGHGLARAGASLLGARDIPVASPPGSGALELGVLAGVVALGILAGMLPAVLAYRTEVEEHLAPLS
jgi:putative ABC transport system permease protein